MPYNLSLMTILIILSSNVMAERVLIGATYPVEEDDALTVMTEKAKKVDWKKTLKKVDVEKAISKTKYDMPRTKETRAFKYTPYYTLEQEIPDKDGKTLYPKGFKYNPLDYFFMPGRIIIIGDREEDIVWLKENRKQTDRVITTGNHIRELQEKHRITAFQFMKNMPERMGVQRVPSIIKQESNYFVVEEIVVENDES